MHRGWIAERPNPGQYNQQSTVPITGPMESQALLKSYGKILRLRINHSYAGFFAYLTFVLNQLRYCEANNFFPVVYFGPVSGDGPNAFHDPRYGDNSWDYYFEPVAGMTFGELCARIADPRDALTYADVVELSSDFLWYLHLYDPESIYNYPYGYYRAHPIGDVDGWYRHQRAKARYYLSKYVRPKQHILVKVELFWKCYLQGFDVIGVHMRGSDKGVTDAEPELIRIVEPREYFPHIDRFVQEKPNSRIFLATEQLQFVQETRARYGDRVVTRDVIRTGAFGPLSNPFQSSTGDAYAKGEEVLIDCLLLAKSTRLLRCTSGVGEYAVYFNENLESIDLNRLPSICHATQSRHRVAGLGGHVSGNPDGNSPQESKQSHEGYAAWPTAITTYRAPIREFIGPGRLFEGAILINLDCRPDRLERSLSELKQHDIDNSVTRMSAYKHENGMYGCSVSHLEAVRYARWKGWQSVLILEDDIKFSENFANDAPAPLHDLCEQEWGLFQFGMMINLHELQFVTPNLFRFKHGFAAHAFALHQRTYDFVIADYVCELDRGNWHQPTHVPFDTYLNSWLTFAFDAYGSRKLLISQHAGLSDTWNLQVNYRSQIDDMYEKLDGP